MRKFLLFIFAMTTCTATSVMAQENFELGKPNNDNYRYLDEYKALKKYINKSKYPNFKLGIGTTVPEYLQKSTVYKMTNKNFTETVAGNAMKMSSCVDGNGNMNFTTVKNYVKEATAAGLNVYGHTLAWHSQQPKGWLLSLIADKEDPNSQPEWKEFAKKDYTKDKTIGSWTSDKTQYGYSIDFDSNGLKISCTKKNTNSWDVQFHAMNNIALTAGKKYTMTITVKGSKNGEINGHLGNWNTNNDGDPATGYSFNLNFTTSWQDIKIEVTPTVDTNDFLLLQVNTVDFTGDVYIKTIKFEGYQGKLIPQTKQEMYDALVGAMDKWIKGMMEACDGKVKGWDLVNEAISGGGDDGQGNYLLQHSAKYNPNGNPDATWDVGGDNFYWQDYLGDIDYVRQACRLARKYGPKDVKLFINDYNLEYGEGNPKLKSLINWIKKWEADGVTKIDGIGTQMHISCYTAKSEQDALKARIVKMFELMAASGKLCRVSELDMGFVKGSTNISTDQLTEANHKKMAELYQWIIEQYLTIIPPEQQWGICQWCPTDAPDTENMWRRNQPVGIWDLNYYRKHVYAGFAEGLGGEAFDDEVIPGDVNGDGLVNVTDIVATVNYIMEKPSDGFIKEAADLSGDGEVNVTDIVKMVSIIMASDN